MAAVRPPPFGAKRNPSTFQEAGMKVEGEEARLFKAIRLDSMSDAHRGELVLADDETGTVVYKDTPDSTKTLTLGAHMIRIVSAKR